MGRVALVLAVAAAGLASAAIGAVVPAVADDASGFTITSYVDGQFVSGSSLALEGTAPPGDTVTVTVTATGGDSCTATADDDGNWDCRLTTPSGTVQVTATRASAATPTPSPTASDAVAPSPSASASGSPSPDPTASADAVPSSITITLHVLGAPALAPATTVGTLISGTGYPGAIVLLTASQGDGPSERDCAVVADDGRWSCTVDLADGDWTMSVRQQVPGHPEQSSPSSAPRTIHVDRTAPAAPVISSPVDGARVAGTVTVTGSGEDGDTISVFLNGTLVCSTPVVGVAFSCSLSPIAKGTSTIVALQRDAVGNYSAVSAAVTVHSDVAGPTATPTPAASPPAAVPPRQSGGGGTSAAPAGPDSLRNAWAEPTGFGSSLTSVTTAFTGSAPLVGLGLAAGFVALVALPLRLARSAIGPRITAPPIATRRRHRGPVVRHPGRALVWMAVGWVAVIVVAAALQGRAEYARMLLAVLVGLAVLNLVGVALVGAIGAAVTRSRFSLRIDPLLLALGASGVLVSSLLGLSPAIILGVVLTSAPRPTADRPRSGTIQAVQVIVVEALAVVAWIAHGAIGGVDVWGIGVREALAAIAISGLCSTVLQLLPIGRLPGRQLFERSPLGWFAGTVASVTLAGVVMPPTSEASVLAAAASASVVGAMFLAAWLWFRWVEPALTDRN